MVDFHYTSKKGEDVAIAPQIQVRVRADKLAKLDHLAELSGMRRGTLLRQILEEFADVAGELADLILAARKGMEAEALRDWAIEVVERAVRDVDQLRLPVSKSGGEPRA
jgi:hypothetical protein